MALPKLEAPTYMLELPSTNEEIKFRPFLVKEQKILMMAQESENENQIYESMSKIINSCTFGKLDATTAPLFDVEYVFLKLRAKSIGETAKLTIKCPDDEKTPVEVEINLDKIDVQVTEGHSNEIPISDTIKLVMRYPQLKNMKGVDMQKGSNVEQIFSILKTCIWEVHDGDKIYNRVDISDKDIEEFIDSFSNEQFEKVQNFFETMPKLRHTIEVENPKTKVKSEVLLEGLESFLV